MVDRQLVLQMNKKARLAMPRPTKGSNSNLKQGLVMMEQCSDQFPEAVLPGKTKTRCSPDHTIPKGD